MFLATGAPLSAASGAVAGAVPNALLNAVANALADSVNALLIGILVAIGIMLPRKVFRKVAALVLIGDWLGVLAAAAVVMFIFVRIQDKVRALLESSLSGWILIVVGIGIGIMTVRSKGQPNALVDKLLGPLRIPSAQTVAIGFVMGVVQSLTSVPFFYGLMHLAAGDFSLSTKYAGLGLYASLALSVPLLCGLAIAAVRANPDTFAGRSFALARSNAATVALWSGLGVAFFLVIMGIASLKG